MALLRAAGYDRPIYIHGAVEKVTAFYQQAGIDLGEIRMVAGLDRRKLGGEIVICPPGPPSRTSGRSKFPDPMTVSASGWMRVRARARQSGVELPLIISDHADWDDLCATVRRDRLQRALGHAWRGRGAGLLGDRPRACGAPAASDRLRRGAEDGPEADRRMRDFARLLDRLSFEPSRNGKIRLMADYFRVDARSGARLSRSRALTGSLSFANAKPAMIRALASERTDPVLFGLSYDYVGDLSETVALMWPRTGDGGRAAAAFDRRSRRWPAPGKLALPTVLARLARHARRDRPLGAAEADHRLAADRRLGPARQDRAGGARAASRPTRSKRSGTGLAPPYAPLFAWLEGRGARPGRRSTRRRSARPCWPTRSRSATSRRSPGASFRPNGSGTASGCRPSAGATPGARRRGSIRAAARTSPATFPDLLRRSPPTPFGSAALDGELLVVRDGRVRDVRHAAAAPEPQGRHRPRLIAAVSRSTCAPTTCCSRRARTCAPCPSRRAGSGSKPSSRAPATRQDRPVAHRPVRGSGRTLPRVRLDPAAAGAGEADADAIEGLMLKRRDSPYVPGRPKGLWFKWKREPFNIDAVMMYAQRGHGKRSSFYSDYTFGVWREGASRRRNLCRSARPIRVSRTRNSTKLDRHVRNNTTGRVRPGARGGASAATRGWCSKIAFEGLNRSTRHKSGVAMRFPRVNRIRWDKPSAEADTLRRARSAARPAERRCPVRTGQAQAPARPLPALDRGAPLGL